MVRASMVPVFLVCFSLVAQTPQPVEGKRISLRDAIQTALQNNLQVTIAQQSREATRAGVMINEGIFDWNLAASAQVNHLNTAYPQAQIYTVGPVAKATKVADNRYLTADLNKLFAWGGVVDFNYAPTYNYGTTKVVGLLDANGNPLGPQSTPTSYPYTGTLSAKYSQPLLRNFGYDVTTAPLVVARKSAEAADYTFQLAIINLVAATEGQYWDLVYAERNLINKRTALELAQKQLKENSIRVQVGTMAPIDVVSAEAQVAQAEQDIITGEAGVLNAKDALIRSLYPNAERPASLEPLDAPTLGHIQLDETAAVKMALGRRVELKTTGLSREIAQVQEKAAVNRVLPQLDAFVQYNGASNSYGAIGPVNGDLTAFRNPGYTVGVAFSVPLQNRAARGSLSTARANLRTAELNLRDLELSITLQVRTAIRNVEAAEKGVTAAGKTRYFQERNLDAEQKKFENGMSTNFNVLQDMTNLDAARSAETQAQINYANAVTALEQAMGNLLEARNFTVK